VRSPIDIIERITKLIALTASANENESTNAAKLACRLIRQHCLRVTAAPEQTFAELMVEVRAAGRRQESEAAAASYFTPERAAKSERRNSVARTRTATRRAERDAAANADKQARIDEIRSGASR
jgi:hypothetical protein